MTHADLEQTHLDNQWRARFGQPVPMLGSLDLVRRILAETATWDLPEAAADPREMDDHPLGPCSR